jgi:nucleoside-diphosphate-sugar epimerase
MSEPLIAILGGTGFVGEALVSEIVGKAFRCRVLIHRTLPDWLMHPLIDVRSVDLASDTDLYSALYGCDIVVNLLRPDATGWHASMTNRLVGVLLSAGIKRYLHVSSIDVYGGTRRRFVEEDTPPEPVTRYEREHAAAEAAAAGIPLDVGIVRLGAVFGPRGRNLLAIAQDMRDAPFWRLALRRSLYGRRRLHLVGVDTVARALLHLAVEPRRLSSERFLVTEDRDPDNEFAAVQDIFAAAFKRPSLRHIPLLPEATLQAALALRGRSDRYPQRRYSDAALAARGFNPGRPLAGAIRELAESWAAEPDLP